MTPPSTSSTSSLGLLPVDPDSPRVVDRPATPARPPLSGKFGRGGKRHAAPLQQVHLRVQTVEAVPGSGGRHLEVGVWVAPNPHRPWAPGMHLELPEFSGMRWCVLDVGASRTSAEGTRVPREERFEARVVRGVLQQEDSGRVPPRVAVSTPEGFPG